MEDWAAVQGRLDAAERDLAERERHAVSSGAGPDVFADLAAERDALASEWDLALLHDDQAGRRDALGADRDVRASHRDRQARAETDDRDPGTAFRFLSGRDPDDAVGDRADALVDRRRAQVDRQRSNDQRQRAATDRDRATSGTVEAEAAAGREITHLRQQNAQLRAALEHRTVIGQAIGLVMAHRGVPAATAFELLVQASQHGNIKLRDLAARIVTARGLNT